MSFNSQVEKLLIDPDIISYFTTGDRDILQFIKKYINVDKILCSSIQKSDLLYDKLEEIRCVVLNQNTQLSNLSTNFSINLNRNKRYSCIFLVSLYILS